MNILTENWRWVKLGLLAGLLLLAGYIGQVVLDKRAQWLAFGAQVWRGHKQEGDYSAQ